MHRDRSGAPRLSRLRLLATKNTAAHSIRYTCRRSFTSFVAAWISVARVVACGRRAGVGWCAGRGDIAAMMGNGPPVPPSAGTIRPDAPPPSERHDGSSNSCESGHTWNVPPPANVVQLEWAAMSHQAPGAFPQAPPRAVLGMHPSATMQGPAHRLELPDQVYQEQMHHYHQYPPHFQPHYHPHYPPFHYHPSPQHAHPAWQWQHTMPQYVPGPPPESPQSMHAMTYDPHQHQWQHWAAPPPQSQSWGGNLPAAASMPPREDSEIFVSRTQRRRRQREALAVKLSILHHRERKAAAGAGPEEAAPPADPSTSAAGAPS